MNLLQCPSIHEDSHMKSFKVESGSQLWGVSLNYVSEISHFFEKESF